MREELIDKINGGKWDALYDCDPEFKSDPELAMLTIAQNGCVACA